MTNTVSTLGAANLDGTLVLCDEVLSVIFSALQHLGSVGNETLFMSVPAVCKRWQFICKHVVTLTTASFYGWAWKPSISDAGLRGVLNRFKPLCFVSVNLASCSAVKDHGVALLAAECPNLEHVDMSNCHDLTDVGVASLAAGCPHLVSLNLAFCIEITDAALSAIGLACPNLQDINIYYCRKVTDNGLTSLATHCLCIAFINIGACAHVTDAGIHSLVTRCDVLRYINIVWCSRISFDAMQSLMTKFPDLDLRTCS
jgi:hypothetical protein